MHERRKNIILRKLHIYFKQFYKKGLVFLQDTEVMSKELLESRMLHEASLLKGMHWSMFALHYLDERFGNEEANNQTAEGQNNEGDPRPMTTESYGGSTSLSSLELEENLDEDLEFWDDTSVAMAIDRELQRVCSREIYGSELDTTVLSTREVDTVLRFLKTCMREFVYEDFMLIGFANSDDRRRFYPNVTSTLMALLTYRLIGDTIKSNSSLWFAKHMSWVYQVDELLSFIRMLYEPSKGYYRKSFQPVLQESADIRHTTAAVLATSVALKLAGCDESYHRIKMRQWIDCDHVTRNIMEHFNDDGGVSLWPPTESHCGAAFCAVAVLTTLGTVDRVPRSKLIALKGWLLKTLSNFGGVSGRLGKTEDVCYSFWLLATLSLLRKCGVHSQVLRHREMIQFLEKCQTANGGIASCPCEEGDVSKADPFHSFACLMVIVLLEEEKQGSETSVLDRLL